MAAPTATTRLDPSDAPTNGIKLEDGHPTKVTICSRPSLLIWEKTASPPPVEGGDAIDTTTFFNTTWRTSAPRALKTLDEFTYTGAYEPGIYGTDEIMAAVNRRDTITVEFPDGSTLAFYGYLRRFEPGEHVEGEMPMATITIVPTNWDPTNSTEEAPVLTNVAGT